MKKDNNVLDLLSDDKENIKSAVLNNETTKKIFFIFMIIVLIICLIFVIFSFFGKVEVPVATQTIYSRQQITDDMIIEKEFPRYKLLKNDFMNFYIEIADKYVAYNKVINKGDYFREDYITDEEFDLDSLLQVEEGYKLYSFPIDLEIYNKNTVNQNEKIDIYFEYTIDNEKKIGKAISNIRVVDIRDDKGLSIFEPSVEKRIPETMYLEVKESDYKLLNKYLNPQAYVVKLYYSSKKLNTNTTLEKFLENVDYSAKLSTYKEIIIDAINVDNLSSNLTLESIIPENDGVIIKGTEHDLNKVAIVKALVDLNKIDNINIGNITLEDNPLKAYSNTGEVVDVEIVPNTINVNITISEKELKHE